MIYFVRHGESEANIKGLFAGQKDDSVLTQKGKEQAEATARKLKEMGLVFDKIISSPLKRALETAVIICNEVGHCQRKIETDSRITEYDMGDLTSTPVRNISSMDLVSAKNAEDVEKFKKRVFECVNEYSKSSDNILLVSHAGVGRILETIKEGLDPKLFYDLPAWDNASVTKIDWIR